MAANASELFYEMHDRIRSNSGWSRKVEDPTSPQQDVVLEAQPGQTFTLHCPAFNLPDFRSVDLRWAVANVLHFFTGVTQAEVLRRYNKHADRFLSGSHWLGAYGHQVLEQIKGAELLLRSHPSTRRAVCTFPSDVDHNINSPACWTALHFLECRDGLDLIVYQRSLNLYDVFPYDCVLLCNILMYMADRLERPCGALRWCVGSLHTKASQSPQIANRQRHSGVILPADLLDDSIRCEAALTWPEKWEHDYAQWLMTEGEVRT